jgi:predicted nucleotidyltransferase component of viral defense system
VIRRVEISKAAYTHAVPEKTIQKDYVITRVLREIGPRMDDCSLRFKGGTCLKKIHFPDYRFSEDLDFTIDDGGDGERALDLLASIEQTLSADGLGFVLGDPEAGADGVTFVATVTGPLGAPDKLKIDVTTREMLFFAQQSIPLLDDYSDRGATTLIRCYSLEEIALEKLVCLIDPARTQPRDLYDIDHLLSCGLVDIEAVAWALPEKARFKGVDPMGLSVAMERKHARLKHGWETQLAQQVPTGALPGFDDVERRFLRRMRELALV